MDFPEYSTQCPDGVLEQIFTVEAAETDQNGRMRQGDLARRMQVATEAQLASYGMNHQTLLEEDKIWVISWTQIQTERLPKAGEQIRLRAWASKKKAVMHVRKYAFYGMDGEPLVCAASLFILMDAKTRSAAEDPEKIINIPIVKIQGEPKPPKMMMKFPEDLIFRSQRSVQENEIDYNGHLNNTCYLDWQEEQMNPEYLKSHVPASVWVQYSKELRLGDTAELLFQQEEDAVYVKGLHEGEESFLMKIEYQAVAD